MSDEGRALAAQGKQTVTVRVALGRCVWSSAASWLPLASHAPSAGVHAAAPSAVHAATEQPGVQPTASAPPVERDGDSATSQQTLPTGPPPEPPDSTSTGGPSATPPPHQPALSPVMQPSTHLRDHACCCLCRAALKASAVDPRSSVLCRACADLVR